MITLCHPIDNVGHLILCSALDAADIPYLAVGEYVGGLYPGIQIPWYNGRSIRMPSVYADEALEVVRQFRTAYSPTCENLTTKSKFRIVLEAILFFWVIPCGSKEPSGE